MRPSVLVAAVVAVVAAVFVAAPAYCSAFVVVHVPVPPLSVLHESVMSWLWELSYASSWLA